MNDRLLAADVHDLALDLHEVPSDDVLAGTPETGDRALGSVAGTEVGVWEIGEGTVRDVEVDEIFVVLSGSGAVEFEDGERIVLGPGVAVRLRAGERTVWEIASPLRKVYVAAG